jgi:hypothetical protein
MTVYPGAIDNNTNLPTATGDDAVSVNANIGATEAIENELGILPSGAYATVRARLDILEARINNPFAPSPNVTNPFYLGGSPISGVSIQDGYGDPNVRGVLAVPGSLYLREDGYYQVLYVFGGDGTWHQTIISNSNLPVTSSTITITANYVVDSGSPDYAILCNATTAINITLPSPTLGRQLVIKDISGNAQTHNITILPHSSEKIDNASTRVIQTNFSSISLSSDGTSWWVV